MFEKEKQTAEATNNNKSIIIIINHHTNYRINPTTGATAKPFRMDNPPKFLSAYNFDTNNPIQIQTDAAQLELLLLRVS